METYASEHGLSIRQDSMTIGGRGYYTIEIVRDGVVMDALIDNSATRLRDLKAMIDRYEDIESLPF